MKNITINKGIVVGAFLFFGIAIFVAAVFTIGSQRKTFSKTLSVKVVFDDVSGLQPGNNVWLSGVKIGTVKKMDFKGNADVEIQMNIDRDAQPHINRDSRAKISSDGFIGNRIVIIFGGSPGAGTIRDGDFLRSEKSVSTDEMMTTLQENNKNLLGITGNLKVISQRIKDGEGTVGGLINDPTVANGLSSSVKHFKAASQNAESVIAKLNDFVTGLNKEGTLPSELIHDTLVYSNIQKTVAQLKDASQSISEFSSNIKQASLALNRTDNPAGTILHDQQVANDLRVLTRNLSTSSEKLDQDLKALQHNFLFRGYFKKQAKEKPNNLSQPK